MKHFYTFLVSLALIPEVYAIEGNGTVDSPFLLKSAADWSEISTMTNGTENADNLSGKYIILSSDIDFNNETFTPIKSFAGNLDGQGHKFFGIKHEANTGYAGIIGTLEPDGYVANLTIEGKATASDQKSGTKVTVSAQYFGGLVGKLYGTLNKCVNAMEVTTTSAKGYAGGLAAYCCTGAKIIDCGNTGSVYAPTGTSAGRAGGIAAMAEKGVEFTRCYNEGVVGLSGSGSGNYAAGIIAEAYPCTFTDCTNDGEFDLDDAENKKSIAGILANAMSASAEDKKGAFIFRNCRNYSDINALGLIAGIAATYYGNYSSMEFYDCINDGDITVTSPKKNSGMCASGIVSKIFAKNAIVSGCINNGRINGNITPYVAGIISYCGGTPTADAPFIIDNCTNSGEITAAGGIGGGIIASAPTYTYLTNCSNTGTISGGKTLGGITANLQGKAAYADKCYNIADIKSTAGETGGIAGKVNGAEAYISNSWNGGKISTSSTVTGLNGGYAIGGIAGMLCYNITNCYNLGDVTGADHVGGIVGDIGNFKSLKMSGCYNAAMVNAPNGSSGALVGTDLTAAGMTNAQDAVTESYYVSDRGQIGNITYGNATTSAQLSSKDFQMGDNWKHDSDYCFPTLASCQSDAARLYSAAVILKDTDTYPSISSPEFNVGNPEGIVWSADINAVSFDGNTAIFTSAYTGELNLIASNGELRRIITLNATVNEAFSGIGTINTNDSDIVEYDIYDLAGNKVTVPTYGNTYIKVATLRNGAVKSTKFINR